jgi:molecular chaperone GrpE (heat shock protein)
MQRQGVMRVELLGKPFDPNVHEAVAETDRNSHDMLTIPAPSFALACISSLILKD